MVVNGLTGYYFELPEGGSYMGFPANFLEVGQEGKRQEVHQNEVALKGNQPYIAALLRGFSLVTGCQDLISIRVLMVFASIT